MAPEHSSLSSLGLRRARKSILGQPEATVLAEIPTPLQARSCDGRSYLRVKRSQHSQRRKRSKERETDVRRRQMFKVRRGAK
jgi:hypothetical protein